MKKAIILCRNHSADVIEPIVKDAINNSFMPFVYTVSDEFDSYKSISDKYGIQVRQFTSGSNAQIIDLVLFAESVSASPYQTFVFITSDKKDIDFSRLSEIASAMDKKYYILNQFNGSNLVNFMTNYRTIQINNFEYRNLITDKSIVVKPKNSVIWK